MKHRFHSVLTPVLVSSVMLAAASQPPSLNGKWRMTIEFPDEARSAGLELERNGEKITGRLIASFVGGEIPIQGSLKDDVVTFLGSTTGGPHPGMTLEFSATLKNDMLAGLMSLPFGDLRWTATRLDAANDQ